MKGIPVRTPINPLAYLAIYVAICLASLQLSAQTMSPWLTRSADNARSGWNSHETTLNQANVTTTGIVRSTIIPLVGDARGMEAQPLIVPNVTTAMGVRDVMVLPSMANVVRGVDAHDGTGIWQVALGTPVTGSTAIDMWRRVLGLHLYGRGRCRVGQSLPGLLGAAQRSRQTAAAGSSQR
jgi:hypothetical protein